MGPVPVALMVSVFFLLSAFGWRSWQQVRLTGSSGFVAMRERGAAARLAGLLMVASVAALGAGLALELGDGSTWSTLSAAGLALMVAGVLATLIAQQAMGRSWRVGVDPNERTELVTSGLFGSVRNPIFSAMVVFGVGAAVTVPSWWTLAGAVLLAGGVVTQVLSVEEPYLRRTHGVAYDAYVARSGRFWPRVHSSGRGRREGPRPPDGVPDS